MNTLSPITNKLDAISIIDHEYLTINICIHFEFDWLTSTGRLYVRLVCKSSPHWIDISSPNSSTQQQQCLPLCATRRSLFLSTKSAVIRAASDAFLARFHLRTSPRTEHSPDRIHALVTARGGCHSPNPVHSLCKCVPNNARIHRFISSRFTFHMNIGCHFVCALSVLIGHTSKTINQ